MLIAAISAFTILRKPSVNIYSLSLPARRA